MLRFNIRTLVAWLPNEEAKSSNKHGKYALLESPDYSVQILQVRDTRRMSYLSRMATDLSLKVSEGMMPDHAVLASRHGELLNSAQLLEMIAKNEILSPTLFSQSVHNAALGLYSIHKKLTAPTTSIAAGKNSFHQGLLSACLYLKENPSSTVLYTFCDQKVPVFFEPSLEEKNIPCGVSLLLTAGDQYSLEAKSKIKSQTSAMPDSQAIQFINWFFRTEKKELSVDGDVFEWKWQRCES